MIEPAFRSILAGNAAVTALVADRIYVGQSPQNERRHRLVITLTSMVHHHAMEGRAGYSTGTAQVDALAPTVGQSRELADVARDALDGFDGSAGGVEFGRLDVIEQNDIPAAPLEGQAVGTGGTSIECDFLAFE